jgi:prophage regulatory protein
MSDADSRLIRLSEVLHLTGLGKSQVYALTSAHKFPEPIKLSERCVAWAEIEVRAWIAERLAAREAKKAATA